MIYLLTAIGLPPGGSCTVHIYTQTVHRTTQNKEYVEQQKICSHFLSKQFLNYGIGMTNMYSVCAKKANIGKRKAISQRKLPCISWRDEITVLQVLLNM
jgi:hypothetical protein